MNNEVERYVGELRELREISDWALKCLVAIGPLYKEQGKELHRTFMLAQKFSAHLTEMQAPPQSYVEKPLSKYPINPLPPDYELDN